jgi:glycosyltransferase involved in cell wall biosynthesis
MKNRRVAICHQTVSHGDAIGNDITGMCELLRMIGFEPTILCEQVVGAIDDQYVRMGFDADAINDYEIVIYHHSIFWEKGTALLNTYDGTPVLKYHNITPRHFFEPYSAKYVDLCGKGIAQTKRLVNLKKNHYWLADSEYNRDDLIAVGEHPDRIMVVPPFNQVDVLLDKPNLAQYGNDGPFYGLFIGRMVPNKGYPTLLRILHSYRTHLFENLVVRLVGQWDGELARYRAELDTQIVQLDLGGCVEFLPHVSQDTLTELLRSSHVYICTSYHEGFCVPVIEAQASGLPIVAMDSTAVRGTAGEGQLVAPEPCEDTDYLFYAKLLHEVFTNVDLRRTLVRKGYQNVTTRFTKELIENRFLETLLPLIGRSV